MNKHESVSFAPLPAGAYHPRRPSRVERMDIRGLDYCLRHWGPADAPLLVMLHGHRDASLTWQFVIDSFARDWRIVAPDWRGFGLSQWAAQGYWHQDYLADLDILAQKISPDEPINLIGHSMGGNIANSYAGVRPERVRKLVAIDGFGLRNRDPDELPEHLARWLKSWREPLAGARPYASLEDMAERLVKANPKLDTARALLLASGQHRVNADGTLSWSFDPGHARPFGTLHRVEEWVACWKHIVCPTLWIASGRPFPPNIEADTHPLEWRRSQVPHAQFHVIAGTGHNVQHDAPQELARLIEKFLLT